jgi:hypothetical protein
MVPGSDTIFVITRDNVYLFMSASAGDGVSWYVWFRNSYQYSVLLLLLGSVNLLFINFDILELLKQENFLKY